MAQVKFVQEDMREAMLDISGQDIMTADKVNYACQCVCSAR